MMRSTAKDFRLAAIESLEPRRLLYAFVPAGYTDIGTIHIRPKAGIYASGLTLSAGTAYVLRASGEAYSTGGAVNNQAGESYDGDVEFPASTTVTSWGVSTSAGSTSTDPTAWGAAQSDHVYQQQISPGTAGPLSFAFANDGTVAVSTLAVTVYAPVPHVSVGMIRTDRVAGSIDIEALPGGVATVPVNSADFDHNGVADNVQKGTVPGDGFLLPITLPAVTDATSHSHYTITVPKAFRVWLNPDRTGSTAGIGLRETSARTVYLEVRSELPRGATADVRITEAYDGTIIEQDIAVATFQFTGPTTVASGQKGVYGSDASASVNSSGAAGKATASLAGKWSSAVGGSLDTSKIATSKTTQYANVFWGQTPLDGYVDFRVNGDFIWGLPVVID